MQQINVLLFQSDPQVTQLLAVSLSNSVHRVQVASSMVELRHSVARHRPFAIILDMETVSFAELESLTQEFRGVRVVCNHRVADEEMWARSLNAGADDFCYSFDTRAIISAALPEERRRAARAA
jgi:DNA-binding NarL/FixJ family response regulator